MKFIKIKMVVIFLAGFSSSSFGSAPDPAAPPLVDGGITGHTSLTSNLKNVETFLSQSQFSSAWGEGNTLTNQVHSKGIMTLKKEHVGDAVGKNNTIELQIESDQEIKSADSMKSLGCAYGDGNKIHIEIKTEGDIDL